jgi:hypothetical protein
LWSEWKDGSCLKCRCILNGNKEAVAKCISQCLAPVDADDYVLDEISVPNECCLQYTRTACKDGSKTYRVIVTEFLSDFKNEGSLLQIGLTWTSEKDSCKKYECVKGQNGVEKNQINPCPICGTVIWFFNEKMSLSSSLKMTLGSAERASSSRKMLRNVRRQNVRALGPKVANWGAQVINHRVHRLYLHQDAKRKCMLIYLLLFLMLSANGDVLEIYLFSSVTFFVELTP